jgi:hypothetical protein
VDELMIGPTAFDLNVVARPNKRWAQLEGLPLLRDSAGRLLTAGGFPLPGGRRSLGSAEPSWTGSWSNVVAWKRLTLTALVDVRAGGHVYSLSNMFGNYTGVLETSLRGREVEWNKPGVVVRGIDVESGEANRDTITAEQYWQTIGSLHEPFIYSAGYVKLREVRLDLALPRAVAARLAVRNASVALTGRNLLTHARLPNFDPEYAYNNGNNTTEFAPMPTARSIGFNLRLSP